MAERPSSRRFAVAVLAVCALLGGCGEDTPERTQGAHAYHVPADPDWTDGILRVPVAPNVFASAEAWKFEFRLSARIGVSIERRVWGPGQPAASSAQPILTLGEIAGSGTVLLTLKEAVGGESGPSSLLTDARTRRSLLAACWGVGGGASGSRSESRATPHLLVVPAEAPRHTHVFKSGGGQLGPHLLLLLAWDRRQGVDASVDPSSFEEAAAAFRGGAAWFLRLTDLAEQRVLAAIADTLLDVVRAEIFQWKDGDVVGLDQQYGRHGLFRSMSVSSTDVLANYEARVTLSRPARDPAEADAEPIAVTVTIARRDEPDAPLEIRRGTVTEAVALAMDHEAILKTIRERHEGIAADLEAMTPGN